MPGAQTSRLHVKFGRYDLRVPCLDIICACNFRLEVGPRLRGLDVLYRVQSVAGAFLSVRFAKSNTGARFLVHPLVDDSGGIGRLLVDRDHSEGKGRIVYQTFAQYIRGDLELACQPPR